ncbi:UBA domain-containing protein 3-like [Prosopis cineraria]|uniref:UBA domain-containing protein 3-like n=1 Tax=Prosopis cineraria TaxID=364024 RepID=UPI00240FF6E1|nr:UBA domain-containing protein 3-like [Prosopis cineraria]XP_054798610.1 UBA domain-containing protein 3-like [Prosopis cineraria]
MGSRMKEDDRIEREIRSLSKLPENRRCINCNSLGPQYVCTTFWTFVCTNCSGIQREFNHRVKSVSMAKFTAEEVTALQAGGNKKAKQIYLQDWDPHRHSYPDTNNIPRLRDFIKQVYVDRKFSGERTQKNLPRLRLNNKEESYDRRKLSFSRRERYEDGNDMHSPSSRNEDRSVKYYYDDRRSPRYAPRNGNPRRNPIKIEVVDDRFRDDESITRRFSSIESKQIAVPSDGQKNVDRGKKVPLASGGGSAKENPAEQKSPETQILSVVTSQVSDAATAPEAQFTPQSNDESDWAPFEISTEKEPSQTPFTNISKSSTTETTTYTKETTKTLDAVEFLLSELSGPLYATASSASEVHAADNDTSTARAEYISVDGDLAPPTSAGQITPFPNNFGASSDASTSDSNLTQPSTAYSSAIQSASPSVRDVPSLNQPTVALKAPDVSSSLMELSPQVPSKLSQDSRPDVGSQPRITQTKSMGRKEIPANLFTISYLPGPAPQAGWQNFQPHNMGYGLQYYSNTAPFSAFPAAAKSTNPFDITDGRPQVRASPFPAMANLHGAHMSTGAGLVRASSLGALGSMVPPSPNYASSSMPPQSPFTPGSSSGPYFEQLNNNMLAPRPQRTGSFNNGETTSQHTASGYMAPGYTLNSFPKITGGNPFG